MLLRNERSRSHFWADGFASSDLDVLIAFGHKLNLDIISEASYTKVKSSQKLITEQQKEPNVIMIFEQLLLLLHAISSISYI